ncbi:MAG: YebC/PmpR family DNA-binding transcriptional regulator [Helicobacter sp.]|nr:YebC/PmpR family DNA-binding transcriptional regulator [Helicobacter sp.]
MGRAFEYRRAAKEKRWDKMSKVFPKLGRNITLAAKEGGLDPISNAKLRLAIASAKAQNMPKDNIEAAIKRASSKDEDLSLMLYEGRASFGVLMLIECATNNPQRTIANLKSYFNKASNAQIVPNGSLLFMFEHKSVFEVQIDEDRLADLELFLIDFGLCDLEFENGVAVIYGDYFNFKNLSDGILEFGLEIKEAGLKYLPKDLLNLDETQIEEIEKLLDRIEEDDDVQNVWTNIS